MTRLLHLGYTKLALLEAVQQYGPSAVLKDFDGTTAEAIAAIAADPREVFTIAPECDHQDAEGRCLGHEVPV